MGSRDAVTHGDARDALSNRSAVALNTRATVNLNFVVVRPLLEYASPCVTASPINGHYVARHGVRHGHVASAATSAVPELPRSAAARWFRTVFSR